MTQNNKNNRMTTFIRNNKNLLIALAAIVIVVLLAIMLPRMTRDGAPETAPETTEEVSTEETVVPVSATPAGEAAYKSAIAEHEGRLITVMDGCVAEPKTQEVTLGEHALLVNASNTPHTFTVGTESYTVGERHYKTLRLETAGEYKVSCDDTKDIATITVK